MTTETESSGSTGGTRARFQETLWSVVLKARDWRSPDSQEAFTRLYESYFYPIYAFIRHRGRSPHDAEELTQAFFCFLLRKDTLQKADPQRGRFRSFLRAALTNFLNNEYAKDHAQKRAPEKPLLSLDATTAETHYGWQAADPATPEKRFDRDWALTLLERTSRRLRAEEGAAGRLERLEVLQACLTAEPDAPAYAEVAGQLGITEDAVKMAVHRLRRRYQALLRDEIAQTVNDPKEIEEELHHLFAALGC